MRSLQAPLRLNELLGVVFRYFSTSSFTSLKVCLLIELYPVNLMTILLSGVTINICGRIGRPYRAQGRLSSRQVINPLFVGISEGNEEGSRQQAGLARSGKDMPADLGCQYRGGAGVAVISLAPRLPDDAAPAPDLRLALGY